MKSIDVDRSIRRMMIDVGRKKLTNHERCVVGLIALSPEQFSLRSRRRRLRQDGMWNELRGEAGEAAE